MPSNTASSSAIAGMVSQRKRLGAVRQALGLESNPAVQSKLAKQAATPAKPFVDEFDYAGHTLDPEKEAKMHQMASDWHYAQDEQAMPANPDAATTEEAPPSAPASTTKPSPGVDAAMAPIAAYYKENGRMPNSEELRIHSLKSQAKQQLGRDASPEELSLFAAKPVMK